MKAHGREMIVGALLAALVGCTEAPDAARPSKRADLAPSNRIEVDAAVVANLGVRFVKAESRRLEERLRVPGRLEVPPSGRADIRAPASGRVRLFKERLDRVSAGEAVAELVTTELLAAQEALFASLAAYDEATLALATHDAEAPAQRGLLAALDEEVAEVDAQIAHARRLLGEAHGVEVEARDRLRALDALPAGNAVAAAERFAARRDAVEAYARELELGLRMEELRAHAAEVRLEAARQRALVDALEARRAQGVRAREAASLAQRQGLRALAALVGATEGDLQEVAAGGELPRWRTLEVVPLRAPRAGVLVELPVADGAWVDASDAVAVVLDPSVLVFRGQVPEGDLLRLPPRALVRVEPLGRGALPIETRLVDALPYANPVARTILIEAPVPNAKGLLPDGLSATAYVLIGQSASPEVVVPEACIVRSDLDVVLFRRDPAQRDIVIRTSVGVGRRADGFVEVLSGVMEGDEVVEAGVHQLKLLGGSAPKGGHVHADGTFHEDGAEDGED